MRFDDPFREEDAPLRPSSVAPSIDRTSRAIRIKLLSLFAMLILVIVLMNEAGKPERWRWMGFKAAPEVEIEIESSTDQDTSARTTAEQAREVIRDGTANALGSDSGNSHPQNQPITISSNQFGSSGQEPTLKPLANLVVSPDWPDYPVAAVEFWNSTFRRLSPNQQTKLLQLLKCVRLGQALPADQQAAAQQLVRQIRSRRDLFQQTLFDKLAVVPDGTPEKTQLANEMYESQAIWDEKVAPAMDAVSRGVDFTIGQQQAVVRLQEVLDPLLYQQVQDHTTIGWTGDSAAWNRIWEKVADGNIPMGDTVSRIELMGQPAIYRGRPVTVEGWVRSARKKTLGPESQLGLPHYYLLWVRPRETKLGPYCIYSSELPEGFPSVTESFSDVNQRVRVNGYSFKIRSYVAADSSVEECPVIVAPGLELLQDVEFTAVNRWQPSRSTLTIALVLIPLIATGLAWAAFRTSKTRPYVPGKKSQEGIDRSLHALVNDPKVQTEREKVMQLYETDSHD